ncbi:hypothetical protein NC651_016890 [Populus alba x Populus x berolinensis]|nr:hypothetical protein NC651_016890 [Populus alba x Populus x berolinensis]
MEPIAACRTSRVSSCEKLVAIGLGLLAVVSPLFIDRRPFSESELDEESIILASWVPLLLLVLILATALSLYLDRSFTSVPWAKKKLVTEEETGWFLMYSRDASRKVKHPGGI